MRRVPAALPLVAFLLSLACAPAPVRAQDATDILTGRVVDETGKPVVHAQVKVTSLATQITRTTYTDDSGKYVLLFPDGGGQYQMVVSSLGLADRTVMVAREGVEEVLITQVTLTVKPVEIQGLEVSGNRRRTQARGEPGARTIALPQRLLDRLPIADFDPAVLASLSPGVVLLPGDTTGGLASFSVAGQRDALNQVTLDGSSINSVLGTDGGGALGMPEEGIRATQVVTSTYDVSRGQFSGGLVAMTSARGVNRLSGSSSYNLQSSALQSGGSGRFLGNGSSQNRWSGGVGGPIVRNRLFYNVSVMAQRRADDLFSLVPSNPADVLPLGASPDSVARFLGILQSDYGVAPAGQTGPYTRLSDGVSVMGRMDMEWSVRHSVMLRLNGSVNNQDNAMVAPTELRQNGGSTDAHSWGAQLGVTSRLGGSWINQLRGSVNGSDNDRTPYTLMPEGRVALGSLLLPADATRTPGSPGSLGSGMPGARGSRGQVGLSTLVFGGDGSLPSSNRQSTVEVSDELSFLLGFTHRLKAGALISAASYSQESGANTLGRFTFQSLEDLADLQPSSFTRTLSPLGAGGSSLNTALYLGDTWRPSDPLQLTLGTRLEHSSYGSDAPADAGVARVFGLSTGSVPPEWHVSPRVGFSYRLSPRGGRLSQITGGFGDFRGQAPLTLLTGGQGSGGLQSQLQCVGSAVPVPDWAAYAADPAAIPTTCAGGAPGNVDAVTSPNVDLVSPAFTSPRSWRASVGIQKQVTDRLSTSVDFMYARGVSLYGVRDLNLDEARTALLTGEGGRLFFGDPALVTASTGEVSLASSRVDPAYGHIYEISSDQASNTRQLTVSVSGMLPTGGILQGSYTLSASRDQSSISGGRAAAGFSFTPVSGDPNHLGWAPSDFERRHAFTGYLVQPLGSWVDVSLIGRISSGAHYTPMVAGDVNGDGAGNDAAFVFDPATVGDTALAAGMSRVLASAPARARACLESQLGRLATRNSCTEGWQSSLDMSATLTPTVPWLGLNRRLSLQVNVQNVLAGMDQLFHGSGNLHGWGLASRSDPTLLRPVGFDAARGRFGYQVNERFGQTVGTGGFAGRGSAGGGFRVYLTGRLQLGANLPGFGGRGFGGGGFGGRGGGMGGMGGRGGLAGGMGGRGGGLPGGGLGLRGARGARGSAGFDPTRILDRMLANPLPVLLELADTLALDSVQVARIRLISDSLETVLAPKRTDLEQRVAGKQPQELVGVLREMQPLLQSGREAISKALEEVHKVLTKNQWNRLPEALKNPFRGGRRPGG